jgi:hypothetical protein
MVRRFWQIRTSPSTNHRSGRWASHWLSDAAARIAAVKKAARRTLGVGVVAGLAYGAWRAYRARVVKAAPHDTTWEAAPFPFPPIPRPAAAKVPAVAAVEPWIEPVDGACPDSHPVKGKLASGIYHVPGGLNYARTRPDRCYLDPTAAEADGLRPAKR